MLKVKVENGHIDEMIAGGNLLELTADICGVVNQMYFSLKEGNEECAEMFKMFFKDRENIDAMFCTCEELDEKIEEMSKGNEEKKDKVEELNEKIKEFTEFLKEISNKGEDEAEHIEH